MDDEIDLRIYIRVLLRTWYWIVGCAVIAAAAAFAIASLRPPVYEASSLIAVTQPRYSIQFDARFETTNLDPAYRVYPDLATSDGLLRELLSRMQADGSRTYTIATLKELRSAAEAAPGDDPSLIYLKVQSELPDEAVAIADLWADLLVEETQRIYGPQEDAQLGFVVEQLALTRAEVDAAEAALVEFEARNLSGVLKGRLDAYQSTYVGHVRTLKAIDGLKRNIEGLQRQLEGTLRPAAEALPLADQLTLLLLQIKVFDVEGNAPFEIQINDAQAMAAGSPAEQRALLISLLGTLNTKAEEIELEVEALEPDILALQRRISELDAESDRLRTELNVAREAYLVLARKHAEVSIASGGEADSVRRVGAAVVPEEPVSRGRLTITLGAGAAAAFICVVVVFFIEYWQEEPDGDAPGVPSTGHA